MDNIIYIIFVIGFFILFLVGLGFTVKYILFYKYQFLILSIAICILFFFISYMILFYKYDHNTYPPNTNPCPDFWELQKDGTCLINDSNIGFIPKVQITQFNQTGGHRVNAYSMENIPYGYQVQNNPDIVDFTDVNWSTYNGAQSRNCALKAWSNKNGIIWDGIHNFNGCKA